MRIGQDTTQNGDNNRVLIMQRGVDPALMMCP